MDALARLQAWCEREGFKGWDPYDGLNSKVFQAIPGLKHSALCRLVMIQAFKRCPVNLRPLALVPKEYNAKGIGLFLQGYCNLYKAVSQHPAYAGHFGSGEALLARIRELGDLLLSLRSKGEYHGACWGYNFDWQARRLFLFPKYTPTVVATNFCAAALLDAFEVTGEARFRDAALGAAEFVLQDLHRYACAEGFLFSYSPLPGNDTVYNASLLGSKLLARCYAYTGDARMKEAARASVQACCAGQGEDGSWVYGLLPVQGWIDSFHTGYNLDGLVAYEEYTGDKSFHAHIEKGLAFYLEHFFEPDGTPKYYHNQMYPIDIHCPGQLFVSLYRLGRFAENRELAEKVLAWTLAHMQDRRGYFYYQLKQGISSKIPYMRWSNAFMFNALSYYLLAI
ncbi:MAG: delta-aminolevulinic acid dehydratase [Bacteroidales bacterium]|nr:delta-aminolevulinic acid dehydratase [Bacteroidales bacterium]